MFCNYMYAWWSFRPFLKVFIIFLWETKFKLKVIYLKSTKITIDSHENHLESVWNSTFDIIQIQ